MGLEFAGAVAGFTLIGYWVDRHYATGPWGVVVGAALGLTGGLYNLVKESLRAVRDAARGDAARKSGDRTGNGA
jgi:F0F1-type ATP synthase assembly protein I